MKKVIFVVLLLLYSSLQAQNSTTSADDKPRDTEDSTRIAGHVYHVNFWGSVGITVGAELAILGAQQLKLNDKPEISDAEFNSIQSQPSLDQLNPIDRLALHMGLPSRDYTYIAADYQILCAAAPLALLFGERYRKNWDDIVLLMAEVNAINMFTFQFSPFGPFFQKRIQ